MECLSWSVLVCLCSLCSASPFYTAAVFEHARVGGVNDSAEYIREKNLAIYRKAAEIARVKGADIIVFPEYGIVFPDDRERLKPHLENIPDPRLIHTNPCQEKKLYSNRPTLRSLSCIARLNDMYVVANMGDIQECTEKDCPEDGAYHYNTNVVFKRDGTLLMKYHKEHLFFEMGMDLDKEKQDPTFKTEFGRFATFTSFDIIFRRMGDIARTVDAVFLTSMWVDLSPQLNSVPFWQAWAIGNNATLLVSNVHIPGYYTVGCGVFGGRSGSSYTYDPDGYSKLLVTKIQQGGGPFHSQVVAIAEEDWWHVKQDGKSVGVECSRKVLNETEDIHNEHRCVEEDISNYTFVKLNHRYGHVDACNNGMCCSLDYYANKMSENFYLGIYNGTYNAFNRYFWCEENCVLARCDPLGDKPCGSFPLRSTTRFNLVHLRSNFTTRFVYPSVVESGMRLVPRNHWKYSQSKGEGTISIKSQRGKHLTVVGFKGRCYSRDPEYIR